jgi:hypothetical protein
MEHLVRRLKMAMREKLGCQYQACIPQSRRLLSVLAHLPSLRKPDISVQVLDSFPALGEDFNLKTILRELEEGSVFVYRSVSVFNVDLSRQD